MRQFKSARSAQRFLVSLVRHGAGVKLVLRRRMGALTLLGPISPLLSTVPHPSVPSARTVARAARRARMRNDGTWSILSGLMWPRIAWMCTSGPLLPPAGAAAASTTLARDRLAQGLARQGEPYRQYGPQCRDCERCVQRRVVG
jgi:hypothetical protein